MLLIELTYNVHNGIQNHLGDYKPNHLKNLQFNSKKIWDLSKKNLITF